MELYYPLLLDGATGTELQKRGFSGNMPSEKWILENPDSIIEIQQEYITAGSNIVYAPTFGANSVKLEENAIFNQVNTYNQQLVALSKEAAAGKAFVAGDISPTGKFLAPMGDISFEDLFQIYREQAIALESSGVDLFVIETMMTVSDARAAVLAVKSVSNKPIFVTFTCDTHGKTVFGSDIVAVLQIMQGLGIDAFGLNCSVGPEDMMVQLRRLQEYSEIPLIAKPNAGLPEIVDGKTVYNCPPEEFAAVIPAFAECGVCIFGGCCGTHSGHINAIRQALDSIEICKPFSKHLDILPVASEKKFFALKPDVKCAAVIDCDQQLTDKLENLDIEANALLGLRISNPASIDFLAENQLIIDNPICFFCDDHALLEQALRVYQGRALYEGRITKELELLQNKYGLIY